MASSRQYAAAKAAALVTINEEIKAYVPAMFQDKIPANMVDQFAEKVSKASVDASEETQP